VTEYELEAAKATAVEVEAKIKAAEAMRDESAAKRDKAGAEVGAANARLQVARADHDRVKAQLDYTRVVAPYDGVVTRRNLHSGAFLSNKNGERPPIFTVMRTDRLRIIVDIAEKDVRFLDVQHPEQHLVQVTLDALPGKQFVWPLKRFAPVLGGGKKVRAEIEIPNPDKVFFPGMYGHAAVILETKKQALTVPAVCLSSDASGAFVWLVVDGQAKQQRVTIGLNDGKKAELPTGLTGTEQIITSGKEALREGQAVVATDALHKGDDETRVFAAQALALLPDVTAKTPLVEALKDNQPAVRLYALNALSMLGKLPDEEPYQTLRQKDANRDVRSHAAFAIERDDKPQPEAIRRLLRDYDLTKMATAKVGEKAPDFTLTSAAGKEVQLSDFRGKKPVVLVFVYGDT
jgi:RND family efflux transporter MFP subunit